MNMLHIKRSDDDHITFTGKFLRTIDRVQIYHADAGYYIVHAAGEYEVVSIKAIKEAAERNWFMKLLFGGSMAFLMDKLERVVVMPHTRHHVASVLRSYALEGRHQ